MAGRTGVRRHKVDTVSGASVLWRFKDRSQETKADKVSRASVL